MEALRGLLPAGRPSQVKCSVELFFAENLFVQAAGLPPVGHYEGFYQPGAQAPPGFPGGGVPQQNGNASHDHKGLVKQASFLGQVA